MTCKEDGSPGCLPSMFPKLRLVAPRASLHAEGQYISYATVARTCQTYVSNDPRQSSPATSAMDGMRPSGYTWPNLSPLRPRYVLSGLQVSRSFGRYVAEDMNRCSHLDDELLCSGRYPEIECRRKPAKE